VCRFNRPQTSAGDSSIHITIWRFPTFRPFRREAHPTHGLQGVDFCVQKNPSDGKVVVLSKGCFVLLDTSRRVWSCFGHKPTCVVTTCASAQRHSRQLVSPVGATLVRQCRNSSKACTVAASRLFCTDANLLLPDNSRFGVISGNQTITCYDRKDSYEAT
jgi:hypothetical protein